MAMANQQRIEQIRKNDLANELPDVDLARTGPDTPGGRIMSVNCALYPGESGRARVIDYRCPHRSAQRIL